MLTDLGTMSSFEVKLVFGGGAGLGQLFSACGYCHAMRCLFKVCVIPVRNIAKISLERLHLRCIYKKMQVKMAHDFGQYLEAVS